MGRCLLLSVLLTSHSVVRSSSDTDFCCVFCPMIFTRFDHWRDIHLPKCRAANGINCGNCHMVVPKKGHRCSDYSPCKGDCGGYFLKNRLHPETSCCQWCHRTHYGDKVKLS